VTEEADGLAGEPFADLRETHSGVVVLLGAAAYKLKKPIRLPFLDFSTPDLRRAACEREIALNRRLAPDVYLGLASLDQPTGTPGTAEPLVAMRRMPAASRLSRLVRGQTGSTQVRAVARLMAQFHAHAQRGPRISAAGRRDRVLLRWQRNLSEAAGLPGSPIPADLLDRVRSRSQRYLAGRELLFEERIAQGKVVDGHGDLLADDIFCLPDGPRVLDCLDFDDQLRYVDQIDDIACLAMDLLRLGRPDLAAQLVHGYLEFSADRPPRSLIHHYIAYRAFMRAKVTAIRLQSQPGGTRGDSSEDPVALSRLALGRLDTAAVRLVLVGGPPGSGKSTLAGSLAERLGYVVIGSDRVRKELAGIAPQTPAAAPFEEGIYTEAWTARTYAEMRGRAGMLLARGESVILDASWRDPGQRAAAARLAEDTAAELVQLRCELPAEVAAQRLRDRRGVSDADERIAAAIRDRQTPWPDSVGIDTAQTPDLAVDAAVAAVLAGGAIAAASS
jgi:uncharacterized protein